MTTLLEQMIKAHQKLVEKVSNGDALTYAEQQILSKIESAPAFKEQRERYAKSKKT